MRQTIYALFLMSASLSFFAGMLNLFPSSLESIRSEKSKYISVNQAIRQFGRMIYLHEVEIEPYGQFRFPKGAHLYKMQALNNKGGLDWIGVDQYRGYHIAMDAGFYISQIEMLSGEIKPIIFGDRYFQQSDAAHDVALASSVKGYHLRLTFFTLDSLPGNVK